MTKLLMMVLGMCLMLHVQAANSKTDTAQLNSLFFRGTEYTKILTPASGSPYLYHQLPGDRKILYYEQWFTSAELLYDAEDDAVVTRDISGGIRVVMTKEKVKEFYIGSKRFIRVGDAGYFEVLYGGGHSVLVKWQKVPIRKGTDDPVYKTYSKVYVLDKSVLTEVGSGNDLLKITGKDGKRYMEQVRSKGLSFRKDFPNAAAEMMRIADQNASNE